jgi:hypothetical protein
MTSKLHRIVPCTLILLASAFLPACASSQSRPVASYSSALRSSDTESRQLASMSDEDIGDQPAGSIRKEKTAESQTTAKKGKIQKQESEVTELVETDITTVIDTSSSPTSDQDLQ